MRLCPQVFVLVIYEFHWMKASEFWDVNQHFFDYSIFFLLYQILLQGVDHSILISTCWRNSDIKSSLWTTFNSTGLKILEESEFWLNHKTTSCSTDDNLLKKYLSTLLLNIYNALYVEIYFSIFKNEELNFLIHAPAFHKTSFSKGSKNSLPLVVVHKVIELQTIIIL